MIRSLHKAFQRKRKQMLQLGVQGFQTFHQIFNQTFNLLRPKVLWLLHPHWAPPQFLLMT